jgi:ankyrin repeat protein
MMLESRLKQAVLAGDTDECRRLLEQGANANHYDGVCTLLGWACQKGEVDACRLLIEAGAEVDNSRGWTPLRTAVSRGVAPICRLLLDAGANLENASEAGRSALLDASCSKHAELCELLIPLTQRLEQADQYGQTPLMKVAQWGSAALCKQFLDAGADPNLVDKKGWSAYSLAIANDRLEVCKLFLERGCSARALLPIEEPPFTSLTPFQVAVYTGAATVAGYFLVELGEDPAQRTDRGRTMNQLSSRHAGMKALLSATKTMAQVNHAVDSGGKGLSRRVTLSPL